MIVFTVTGYIVWGVFAFWTGYYLAWLVDVFSSVLALRGSSKKVNLAFKEVMQYWIVFQARAGDKK